MKKTIVFVAVLGFLPAAFAQTVYDNFNSGFDGWSNANNTNVTYFSIAVGQGINGSDALDYSVQAAQNVGASNTNAVTGTAQETILMRTDFRFSLTGDALTNAPNNGVNDGFLGLYVSDTPDWFNGVRNGFQFCRRGSSGGNWGMRVPSAPFVDGFGPLTDLGFPDNSGAASTSAWNSIEMTLTPASSNYLMQVSILKPDSTPVFESDPFETAIPVGTPMYGGYWNAFHIGTNTIAESAKVNSILFDNFAFSTVSFAEIEAVSFEEIIGYQFTSDADKTHRLQYSLNGGPFLNTGASVAGDGSVQTLTDPALNTEGRTYRVTSD